MTNDARARDWRILLLEDVEADATLIIRHLQKSAVQCHILHVSSGALFESALLEYKPDVVLSDFSLPRFSAFQTLDIVKTQAPNTPVIIITGAINKRTALQCIDAGAVDYVLKEDLLGLAATVITTLLSQKATHPQKSTDSTTHPR